MVICYLVRGFKREWVKDRFTWVDTGVWMVHLGRIICGFGVGNSFLVRSGVSHGISVQVGFGMFFLCSFWGRREVMICWVGDAKCGFVVFGGVNSNAIRFNTSFVFIPDCRW